MATKTGSTQYRIIAAYLRDRGYTIYELARLVPPPAETNIVDDQPDILALHRIKPPLRVYLSSGKTSSFYPDTKAGGQSVYCNGYEDLVSLLATGRPAQRPETGSLF